jgi:hypothetical protein
MATFTNQKLKKIVNVYQLQYKNGRLCGLGDFLRGSFCLFQICKNIGIDFDINLKNHPMSFLIECENHTDEMVDYENINFYLENNYNTDTRIFYCNFINHINDIDSEIYYLCCNSFPVYTLKSNLASIFLQEKIKPKNEMRNYVINELKRLHLFPKSFNVIHIRTGDKYLINKEKMDLVFLDKIKSYLLKFINPNKKYLIISDNNIVKNYLKTIPCVYVYIKQITHLGEGDVKEKNKINITNTMLDFYVMSYSCCIYALSVHLHGTGFSEYCSKIYNIPYKKCLLPE